MQQPGGLRADQVKQVRGFADQRLRNLKDPLDSSNRRISIIVQNLTGKTDDPNEEGSNAAASEIPSTESGKAEKGGSRKPPPVQKE
jgi:chemotaxis protein MotB